MNITILVNPESDHVHRVDEAIEIVNGVQSYFRLRRADAPWLPNNEEKEVDGEEIRERIEKKGSGGPAIAVIENPLEESYFSNEFRRSMIITVAEWETEYAPPPIRIYLAYLFVGGLLNFAADLSDDMIGSLSHEPPIGCFFDACQEKESIKLGMVGANLCGECETKLFGMGLSDEALRAVEEILLYVRNATIRRPRKIPSRIFIGHGHSDAWHRLASFLADELHLAIEEFNREPVAGLGTLERLNQMLERTRLAFLVMTPEDLHDDDKKHARENVVHEIGLFQGRLGFRKAIILKEKSVEEFSNIHGLTYVSFPKGKPQAAFGEIRRILEREGIVQPLLRRKNK